MDNADRGRRKSGFQMTSSMRSSIPGNTSTGCDPWSHALVLLSRLLDWRSMLTVVKPDTLIRWHRQGWRLFWRWKSRPGRPPIPADLRRLIVTMARANPTWGEERIADELLLKLGLAVSPRTVGRNPPALATVPRRSSLAAPGHLRAQSRGG